MHVTLDLLRQIAAMRSPHLVRSAGRLRFSLVFTVEECAACRFSTGSWNDPLLEPVTNQFVKQLGWKLIENAPGRRAFLHCEMSAGDAAQSVCTIDLGYGFRPLPVRESEGR